MSEAFDCKREGHPPLGSAGLDGSQKGVVRPSQVGDCADRMIPCNDTNSHTEKPSARRGSGLPNNAWPEAKVEELRRWHADGLSARDIAVEMRITRNAVIGKLSRMELPPNRPSRPPADNKVKPQRRTLFRPPLPPVALDPPPEHRSLKPVGILGLTESTCRYPISGTKEHTLYCGDKPWEGCIYCVHHWRVTHVTSTQWDRQNGAAVR